MTFEQAIVFLKEGSPIRCQSWPDDVFLFLEQEHLCSNELTADLHFMIIVSDLFSSDWVYGFYDSMNDSITWKNDCR